MTGYSNILLKIWKLWTSCFEGGQERGGSQVVLYEVLFMKILLFYLCYISLTQVGIKN